MARVVYENVTKRFGNFEAVKNFSLEINDHEFLCLVGPSGCGKTTTLRMLAGLDEVSEGVIKIEDKFHNLVVVNEVPAKDRGIAMVFQSYALYPHYNVYDNLAFGLRAKRSQSAQSGRILVLLFTYLFYVLIIAGLYGISQIINLFSSGFGDSIFIAGLISFLVTIVLYSDIRKSIRKKIMSLFKNNKFIKLYVESEREIEEKVRDIAELLEIEQQLNKKPRQLSGGQRQRVALGRAIIRNPTVFLLDEPLSNLDAKLRVQMRAELQRLSHKLGVTSIYVTHDQIEAMTLGHRIAVMNQGVIQQVGTPNEVYLKPNNKFVAGFIGSPSMNFIEGVIEEKNGNLYFVSKILDYKLSEEYNFLKNYINQNVILGIRPEHIYISSENINQNHYSVKIGVVEPIGSDTYIHVDFTEHFIMIIKFEGISSLRVGNEINITFDDKQMHFFEKDSETRIVPKIK